LEGKGIEVRVDFRDELVGEFGEGRMEVDVAVEVGIEM